MIVWAIVVEGELVAAYPDAEKAWEAVGGQHGEKQGIVPQRAFLLLDAEQCTASEERLDGVNSALEAAFEDYSQHGDGQLADSMQEAMGWLAEARKAMQSVSPCGSSERGL